MADSDYILKKAYEATAQFVDSIPKVERKRYGQFFTSERTASFMASLFEIDFEKDRISILDAGCGTGLLTTALVSYLRRSGYSGGIDVVCYETDSKVMPTLMGNLDNLKNAADIKYEVRFENYITSQSFGIQDFYKRAPEHFDMIIGNPPYLKIPRNAPEAKAMPEVCHGAPNLYFLFWAMGISNLRREHEMVYIIPRSWTSGAYFERFRRYLFRHCVITDIHIFDSRDKIFDGESVLQETMIIKVRKTLKHPENVRMTASSTSDFMDLRRFDVPYDTVVSQNGYVFLVTNSQEADVLSRVNRQNSTLDADDLRMRTGIIVDFRTQDVLRNEAESGTYPLFYSSHIRDGRVVWPIGREYEYILTDRKGYLQENTNYLFVKRFTSKEERRRLQCGIYLPDEHQPHKYISTQNKINYIKCDDPELAYGLYVILNSTLYDSYYRLLNGSTQVNSTEINAMPVPSRGTIREMGRELIGHDLTEQNCNHIVDRWIR